MRRYLSDLPDEGRYPPDRWRVPDAVEVVPVRSGTGEIVDGVVTPIYMPAEQGDTFAQSAIANAKKFADARHARGAMGALAKVVELEDVRGFVNRFGVLNLDRESGLPRWPVTYLVTIPNLPDNARAGSEYARHYVALGRALDKALEVLNALRLGDVRGSTLDDLADAIVGLPRVPASADSVLVAIVSGFERLHSTVPVETRRSQRERRARLSLAAFVNWWMAAGNVSPLLRWPSGRLPEVRWNGGLWGAIGSQLLVAVAEEPKRGQTATGREIRWKSVECDHCHDEIFVQRRKNGKHYCKDKPKCQAARMRNERESTETKTARVRKSRTARRRS